MNQKFAYNTRAHVLRWVLASLPLAAWPQHASAADAEDEASLEVELRYRLDADTRLHAMVSSAKDKGQSFSETAYGLALDQRSSPNWSYRLGVRYIQRSEESDSSERRGVADLTWQRKFTRNVTLLNRARTDLRWREENPFIYRVRDRILAEKLFPDLPWPTTVYSSMEIYHDSRYSGIARSRGTLGVSVELNRLASIDIYYSHTSEYQPDDKRSDALGLALVVQFQRSPSSRVQAAQDNQALEATDAAPRRK